MYFSASVELSTWKAAQVTLAEHTGMSGPVAERRTVVMPFQTRIWMPPCAWKTTAVELTLVTRVMWNEVTTLWETSGSGTVTRIFLAVKSSSLEIMGATKSGTVNVALPVSKTWPRASCWKTMARPAKLSASIESLSCGTRGRAGS